MKIAVGSTNPVKVGAARSVIERIWPEADVAAIDVHTGVRAMPMSDLECQTGARNRAQAAREAATADLGVCIERRLRDRALCFSALLSVAKQIVEKCVWLTVTSQAGGTACELHL